MTIAPPHTQVCSSQEVDALLAEIRKAQSLQGHVQALHQSPSCEEPAGAMQEVGGQNPRLRSSRGTQLASLCSPISPLTQGHSCQATPAPPHATHPPIWKVEEGDTPSPDAPTTLSCPGLLLCQKDPGGFSFFLFFSFFFLN